VDDCGCDNDLHLFAGVVRDDCDSQVDEEQPQGLARLVIDGEPSACGATARSRMPTGESGGDRALAAGGYSPIAHVGCAVRGACLRTQQSAVSHQYEAVRIRKCKRIH
jgi:hypothetical protein